MVFAVTFETHKPAIVEKQIALELRITMFKKGPVVLALSLSAATEKAFR